jgi:hypothetical protein
MKLRIFNILVFLSPISILFFFYLNKIYYTQPNDGILYYFISQTLYENNFNFLKIQNVIINDKIPTLQLGSSIILTLCTFVSKVYADYLFTSISVCLWICAYFYLLKIKKLFKLSHLSYFYNFLFIGILFQFESIRTSSSLYNEAIYYPLYIIINSIFFSAHTGNPISKLNFLIILIFIFFGIFFQLYHIFICLNFFIFYFFNRKILPIKYLVIIIFTLSFSFLVYAYYYLSLTKLNLAHFPSVNMNYADLNLNFNDIFQKFFNIFLSPLNLHLTSQTFVMFSSDKFSYSFFHYFLSILTFVIFYIFFRTSGVEIFFKNFTIVAICFSFIAKNLISDYDIRYNIYTNFFIIFFYIEGFLKVIKKFNKNKLAIIFPVIIFSFFILSSKYINYNNYNSRKVFQTLTIFKEFNNYLINNKINFDFVIADYNERIIYWVFNKRTCIYDQLEKCDLLGSPYIVIIKNGNEKNVNKTIINKAKNILIY